jgi:hypothetical protein
MDGQILGIDLDLFVTEVGLIVAGFAAIIGIWVERDPARPKRYAAWLSILIGLATGVGMFQCYDDDQDQKKVEGDLARVLAQLDKIASSSDVDIPALNDLIKTELASQARANPGVVANFAQKVSDEGEDPADVLGAYLPESEVQDLARKNKVKPPSAPKAPTPVPTVAAAEGGSEGAPAVAAVPRSQRRKQLSFGGGAPKLRIPVTPPKAEPPPEKKAEEPKKEEPAEEKPEDKADDKTVKLPLDKGASLKRPLPTPPKGPTPPAPAPKLGPSLKR